MIARRRRRALAALLASLPLVARAQQQSVDPFRGRGMPYAAFDQLVATHVAVGGADIVIGFAPGSLDLPQAIIVEWIASSAAVVAAFYGTYPVKRVRVLIVPDEGNAVRSGTAVGYGGAALRIVLGRAATQPALAGDWILIHEMTHLAFPNVPRAHHWIEEGLASYIEPVARAQVGKLAEASVWRQFVDGMPKGLPQAGDRGLDYTPTWGRTYWGGALFCLIADVEIRKQTNNRHGLQGALRAIVVAGGNLEADWPLAQALDTGDAGVGVAVLSDLHAQMGATPVAPDLPAMWRQLGIEPAGKTVTFDNTAPLASLRQSITRTPRVVSARELEARPIETKLT